MTLALPGIDALPPPSLRQTALGQWDTPPDIARAIVAEVDVGDAYVLEPSAGLGNVVEAALEAGAAFVTAVEIDPARVVHLRRRFPSRVEVIECDFLLLAPTLPHYDAIVGNPPYDKGADSAHLAAIADCIERWATETANPPSPASLLLRTVALHSAERWDGEGTEHRGVWSRLGVTRLRPLVQRVAFGEEAGKIDVSIFRLDRHSRGSIEHLRRTP